MENTQTHTQIRQTFNFEEIQIMVIHNKNLKFGTPWTKWNKITVDGKTITETSTQGRMIMNQFEKSPLFKEIMIMDN